MIAILASAYDTAARALVQAWRADDAVLVSARDLCTPGWVLDPLDDADGRFVAEGAPRPSDALRAVVVRRPAVAAEELPWIAAEDREYATAEINAFLVAWLSARACPVLNRPTPTSLCGPAWSQLHWQLAAARAGVAWADANARITRTVLACRGAVDRRVSAAQARACELLAAAADADLLGLRFAGDAVAAVSLQPNLKTQAARAFVRARLFDGATA